MTKKKMAKQTEIVFVLDETGSMSRIKHDTIGGFNTFVKDQAKEEGEAMLTLRLFSRIEGEETVRPVHDGVPLKDVPELSEDTYRPRGVTPLLDAVAVTVDAVGERLAGLSKKKQPDLVVFVVMTDGLENASTEYTAEQVKEKVEAKVEEGWKFVFLGANMDAWAVGTGMGMQEQGAASFAATRKGTHSAYAQTCTQVTSLRRTGKYTQ